MKRIGMKRIIATLAALCLLATAGFCLSGCSEEAPEQAANEAATAEATAAVNDGEAKVEELMQSMTLEEKVWQMFFVRPEDITGMGTVVQAGETTKTALENYPVGGFIYFSQNIESREQLTEMIANVQSYSKIPLFISVDEEGGPCSAPWRRGHRSYNASADGRNRRVGRSEKGRRGRGDARQRFKGARLQHDFAPVADVITVENNEDIGDRSFGSDPELVADMVAAEVEGMQSQNISATLKHFPSNGSTESNTHNETGVCTRTLEEMRSCEFIPFKAGIEAGADVVMVAHMAAVNVTGDETPSTLSKTIVTDLLRGELGFSKVVISDALNMGAITSVYEPEEAAVAAVEAGVDLLLMSPDAVGSAETIIAKVESGEISEDRIDESVRRILSLKQERGILDSLEV